MEFLAEFFTPAVLVPSLIALYVWSSQKRREQRGAAAVQVYDLATRGVEALHQLAAPFLHIGYDDPAKAQAELREFQEMRVERYQTAAEGLRALDEATSRAALLLNGRVEYILRGLLIWREAIRKNYIIMDILLRDRDVEKARQTMEEGWGSQIREQIDATYTALKINIRPFAQYHAVPILSTLWAAQMTRRSRAAVARRLKQLRDEKPALKAAGVIDRAAEGNIQNVHT